MLRRSALKLLSAIPFIPVMESSVKDKVVPISYHRIETNTFSNGLWQKTAYSAKNCELACWSSNGYKFRYGIAGLSFQIPDFTPTKTDVLVAVYRTELLKEYADGSRIKFDYDKNGFCHGFMKWTPT
jgi:hypothetical protein